MKPLNDDPLHHIGTIFNKTTDGNKTIDSNKAEATKNGLEKVGFGAAMTHTLPINHELKEKIRSLCSSSHSAPLEVFLAVFKILLYRYRLQEEGQLKIHLFKISDKKNEGHETASCISVLEQTEVNGSVSFTDHLNHIKNSIRTAILNKGISFEEMDSMLSPHSGPSKSWNQVKFQTSDLSGIPWMQKISEAEMKTGPSMPSIKVDLTFSIEEVPGELNISYSSEIKEHFIARMSGHLVQLLQSIVTDPQEQLDHLKLLTDPEACQLMAFNQQTGIFSENHTILDLFEKQVQQTPDALAVVFGKEHLSYRELDEQANQLGHYLKSKGVKEEVMVPLCLERSLEMVIGIMGILKAGGAYVPIDPEYPTERIKLHLEETGANMVIVTSKYRSKIRATGQVEVLEWEEKLPLVHRQPRHKPQRKLDPTHLAYVIFTSGSSGKPKGVLVEQAQLVSSTLARNSFYVHLSATLLIPSFSFDASVAALFGSLTTGNPLLLCSQNDLQDVYQLKDLLKKTDTIICIPSYYKFLLEEGLVKNSRISTVIVGGEPLGQEVISAHFNLKKTIRLFNEYGPTEGTVWSTVAKIDAAEPPITIGAPVANTDCYILNEAGSVLPIGIPGELHISGGGLARGYLNQPALTSEKFVGNPFSKTPGAKMYRTGDLCHWLPDGTIVHLGRVDEQVKINGFRIEPGEIEAAVMQSRLVKKAAVTGKKLRNGRQSLVAYVIPNGSLDREKIRAYLLEKLPAYMVPSIWVELDKFPVTQNGKVDKLALKLPDANDLPEIPYVGPRNQKEKALVKVWQSLLRLDRVGVFDDFFNLGGNSLLAMRVIAFAQRELNLSLSIKDLFNFPTIAALAENFVSSTYPPPFHPVQEVCPRPKQIPLSFQQESLWFIDQLEGSVQYHLPLVYKIYGPVDEAALQKSLKDLVKRHEVLRTVIRETEDFREQYVMDADNWEWSIIRQEEPVQDEESLLRTIQGLVQIPFDLSHDYMIRAHLIRRGPEANILVLTLHHIAFDGWSTSLFLKDWMALFKANLEKTALALAPMPFHYADYSIWQKKILESTFLDHKIDYWKKKLNGVAALQLPFDYPRTTDQSTKGAVSKFNIDRKLSGQIRALAQKEGATLFMTLLAAFKVLLYRYSAQEDICVGTATAGRQQKEMEDLVGYFINTLALRSRISSDIPFTKLIEQVKTITLEAFENQEVPFEKVVAEVGAIRGKNQNPLFQVMFLLQNFPQEPQEEMEKMGWYKMEVPQENSKFDLTFTLIENPDGLAGLVEYSTALYKASTIDQMVGHYVQLLHSMVGEPETSIGKLGMLLPQEKHRLLVSHNNTEVKFLNNKTIVDLFEEQAKKNPNAPALFFEGTQLSYLQLNERANQLARFIKGKGVKEETPVLICLERSLEMIVAILGILKAGAAYVPIDPDYPHQRKDFIRNDTGAQFLISNQASRSKIPVWKGLEYLELDRERHNLENLPTSNVNTPISPNHLAYIIYTSGSTGTPKGVMIAHRNTYAFICWCQQEFSSSQFEVAYASSSICFDLSVFEIFYPLSIGKPIRIIENGLHLNKYLSLDASVMINSVPSVIQSLLLAGTDFSHIKVINMAGESIPPKVLQELDTEKIEVRNLYGPTEDTTYTTVYKFGKEKSPLIGKPISNTTIYITGPEMELVPEGVAGEICIGGAGLARGYWNREKLTREKFVPNPFSKDPNARLYRTGDLGRWKPDGNIEFLGRKDHQVKIRGYRVELGEIERVLEKLDGVKQAVIITKTDPRGERQLIGYFVGESYLDQERIIDFLNLQLPAFMVPSLWVKLDSFPLTPNGKVDRQALPYPDVFPINRRSVAARNNHESRLVKIWKTLLKVERIGIYDDFFELGGHSLLVNALIAAVEKEFKIRLKIKDFFDYPTIAELAGFLQLQEESLGLPLILKTDPRPQQIPLSYNQESLWFIDQLQGSLPYHIPTVLRIKGDLNQDVLKRSLQKIVSRHEVLRTVFRTTEGKPWQHVMAPHHWNLTVMDRKDLRHNPKGLNEAIAQCINSPFDLEHDYMLRAALIILDKGNQVLVLTLHHIASDGWSLPVLLRELQAFYKGYLKNRDIKLLPLPIQYADYAIWQRKFLSRESMVKKLKYWKGKLQNLTAFQFPTDYPRPSILNMAGSGSTFTIEKNLCEKLKLLGQQQGTTFFMTLLASFKAMIYRYTSESDICVGTATAGRQQQETEGLIGYFINPLPLRSTLKGEASFQDYLKEVKTVCLEAFENQEIPFEKIVSAVGAKRDLGQNPLFQVMFVLQNQEAIPPLDFNQNEITHEKIKPTTSKFDFSFILTETPFGLEGTVEYRTDLYRAETIENMILHYLDLLKSVVSNPSLKINDLGSIEEEIEPNAPNFGINHSTGLPEFRPVHSLIEQAAVKFSGKTAIFFREEQCSYRELNERANQLAHYLIEKGIRPGDLIGIVMDRSIEMVVGILAALKAGGAYMPIDTDYPAERIRYMLQGSSRMHLTTRDYRDRSGSGQPQILWEDFAGVKDRYPTSNPGVPVRPCDAAYVIYTSGSTGRPKAVVLEHHSLFNFLVTVSETPGISHSDRVMAVSSVSFDIAILELLLPFVHGAQSFLLDRDQRKDPWYILERIEAGKATLMFATPSHWKMMLETGWHRPFPGFNAISGGEELSRELAERLLPLSASLWNIYGPTETTVFSTAKKIENLDRPITIGRPVHNTRVYILDDSLQPVREGQEGEIFISGNGVARGYLNRPELTAERFIRDPFQPEGGSMYRTGDLGKFTPDGEIIMLGRKDQQVKLRGHRIEPGEIEHALVRLEGIKDAAVAVREDSPGNPRLVAYLTLSADGRKHRDGDGPPPWQKQWRRQLSLSLPDYMVPGDFVVMENFPLTASGKLDRKALPRPAKRPSDGSSEHLPPGTPEERLVEQIWSEALGISDLNITDNFFEIGGHSMIAVQVMTRIEKESGLKLPLSILFKYSTVQKLAWVLQLKNEIQWNSLVPIKPQGNKTPLYIVHGAGLNVLPFYSIAKNMAPEQPIYGLQAKGLNGIEEPLTTVEEIAAHYISEITQHNPSGPYAFAGYSFGGIIAFEMAHQLRASGREVKHLIMFDTYAYQKKTHRHWLAKWKDQIAYQIGKRIFDLQLLTENPGLFRNIKAQSFKKKKDQVLKYLHLKESPPESKIIKTIKKIEAINRQAAQAYVFPRYEGNLFLFRAKIKTHYLEEPHFMGWRPFVKKISIIDVEGKHTTMLSPPHDKHFAKRLQKILDEPKT